MKINYLKEAYFKDVTVARQKKSGLELAADRAQQIKENFSNKLVALIKKQIRYSYNAQPVFLYPYFSSILEPCQTNSMFDYNRWLSSHFIVSFSLDKIDFDINNFESETPEIHLKLYYHLFAAENGTSNEQDPQWVMLNLGKCVSYGDDDNVNVWGHKEAIDFDSLIDFDLAAETLQDCFKRYDEKSYNNDSAETKYICELLAKSKIIIDEVHLSRKNKSSELTMYSVIPNYIIGYTQQKQLYNQYLMFAKQFFENDKIIFDCPVKYYILHENSAREELCISSNSAKNDAYDSLEKIVDVGVKYLVNLFKSNHSSRIYSPATIEAVSKGYLTDPDVGLKILQSLEKYSAAYTISGWKNLVKVFTLTGDKTNKKLTEIENQLTGNLQDGKCGLEIRFHGCYHNALSKRYDVEMHRSPKTEDLIVTVDLPSSWDANQNGYKIIFNNVNFNDYFIRLAFMTINNSTESRWSNDVSIYSDDTEFTINTASINSYIDNLFKYLKLQ